MGKFLVADAHLDRHAFLVGTVIDNVDLYAASVAIAMYYGILP
jgi:hypothetical protein